jgi:hypothetical protein
MKKPATSRKSRTDWRRVDVLPDREIDFSDTPELTPEMFARAAVRRGLKPLVRKGSSQYGVIPIFETTS